MTKPPGGSEGGLVKDHTFSGFFCYLSLPNGLIETNKNSENQEIILVLVREIPMEARFLESTLMWRN